MWSGGVFMVRSGHDSMKGQVQELFLHTFAYDTGSCCLSTTTYAQVIRNSNKIRKALAGHFFMHAKKVVEILKNEKAFK
jgi:hypothetical protein